MHIPNRNREYNSRDDDSSQDERYDRMGSGYQILKNNKVHLDRYTILSFAFVCVDHLGPITEDISIVVYRSVG